MHDRRDDPVDPHRGIYNTVDLGLADHVVRVAAQFRALPGAQCHLSPAWARGWCWRAARSSAKSTRSTTRATRWTPFRCRSGSSGGGNSTDRGFPDTKPARAIPSTGFPLGGTALFFNQTELRFPLVGENIGGVLFHDMGNVYSSLGNLSFRTNQRNLQDFDYMVHAVGFGIRYRTPVGPGAAGPGVQHQSAVFLSASTEPSRTWSTRAWTPARRRPQPVRRCRT